MEKSVNVKAIAQKTLDFLASCLEDLLDNRGEIEETAESVKIILAEATLLLNFHAPSNQIWLSSPLSGAVHFSWNDQVTQWISTRPPYENLFSFLEKDLTHLCGFSINLK